MSRVGVLACLVALPAAFVGAAGAAGVFVNARGGWLWPPDRVTLSEAVATGNYAEVVRQVEDGMDPNPASDVRPELLSSAAQRLTPLQTAVIGRNSRMLALLLEGGAVVGPSGLAVLKCLNEEHADADVRARLEALAPGQPVCADVQLPR